MALTTIQTGSAIDAEYSNVKDTFPASVAPTSGTISTVNTLNKKVAGTGTVFLTDVVAGDFIWFTTVDELVEIENVVSDTSLTLKFPTLTTLTGVAFKIVKKNSFKNISWVIDGAGTAEINTIVYPASYSKTMGNSKSNGEGSTGRLSPILVDSTTNANVVYVSAE